MRPWLHRLHRWLGLSTATFLTVAGLTGAIISWDHELDAWLNPTLYEATTDGPPRDPLALADAVEARDPRVLVTYLPLAVEPGHTLGMFVVPRVDPSTGALFELPFNQLALDPATGVEQGARYWGEPALTRENLLPFLYKLHYSLHLPQVGGYELGVLLMGLVGIVWTFDSCIALWISFPSRKTWRRSLQFAWRDGGRRLVFDLHRSGGVWLWLALLTLAVTSVSMNLGAQVVRPVVGLVSTLTPDPYETRMFVGDASAPAPKLSRAQAVQVARTEALRRGWTAPAGAVYHARNADLYGVGFFTPGNDHGDGGLGNPWLYVDASTGQVVADEVPGQGSLGDVFMAAQFPLHSGRILGVTGRALVSLLGLAVAGFSVTGVWLWARRQRWWRAARDS